MNFAEADYVMTNTPGMLRDMASRMADLGIRIEIEAFDTGHLWLAQQLVSEGLIPAPVMVQLCMGIPWGAPDDLNTFMAMVNNVPSDWIHSAFSIGRHQMAYVAAAVLSDCPRIPRRTPSACTCSGSPPLQRSDPGVDSPRVELLEVKRP